MNTIHLSTAQAMLQRPAPVDLVVWRSSGKNAGELLHYDNCISRRYDYYEGTRTVKLLNSNEIRKVRDVCIYSINGMEVFL